MTIQDQTTQLQVPAGHTPAITKLISEAAVCRTQAVELRTASGSEGRADNEERASRLEATAESYEASIRTLRDVVPNQ